jgi:hypothetical protein
MGVHGELLPQRHRDTEAFTETTGGATDDDGDHGKHEDTKKGRRTKTTSGEPPMDAGERRCSRDDGQ